MKTFLEWLFRVALVLVVIYSAWLVWEHPAKFGFGGY